MVVTQVLITSTVNLKPDKGTNSHLNLKIMPFLTTSNSAVVYKGWFMMNEAEAYLSLLFFSLCWVELTGNQTKVLFCKLQVKNSIIINSAHFCM